MLFSFTSLFYFYLVKVFLKSLQNIDIAIYKTGLIKDKIIVSFFRFFLLKVLRSL